MRSALTMFATVASLFFGGCGTHPGVFNGTDQLRVDLNRKFARLTSERNIDDLRNDDLLGLAAASHAGSLSEPSDRKHTLLYFEEAKAYSALGWNTLIAGNVDEAAEFYGHANEILVDGDRAYAAYFRDKIASASSQAQYIALLTTISATASAGNEGLFSVLSSNFASYLQEHARQTSVAAMNAPRNPTVSLLRAQMPESDGKRIILVPTSGPLMNHGKLYGDDVSCTGGLVGYRLFLTNAHCVFDGNAQAISWDKFWIVFDGLTKIDAVRVEEVHASPDYVPATARTREHRVYDDDWAVLVLDRHPHGRGFYGIIDDPAALPDAFGRTRSNIFLAGYSGDLNDGRLISLDWGCTMVKDGAKRQGVANCRSAPGSSGSPYLLTSPEYQGYMLVALHAWGRDGGTVTSGGPLAHRFFGKVRELRERVGLPSRDYPASPDGVLPPSKAIDRFESVGRRECQFAGRFIEHIGLRTYNVTGNRAEGSLTGAEFHIIFVDEEKNLSIDGDYARGSGNEIYREDDWDFLYAVGGLGARFLLSRVAPGLCR